MVLVCLAVAYSVRLTTENWREAVTPFDQLTVYIPLRGPECRTKTVLRPSEESVNYLSSTLLSELPELLTDIRVVQRWQDLRCRNRSRGLKGRRGGL